MRGLLECDQHKADPGSRRGQEGPEERRHEEVSSEGEFVYSRDGVHERYKRRKYIEQQTVKRLVESPNDLSLRIVVRMVAKRAKLAVFRRVFLTYRKASYGFSE